MPDLVYGVSSFERTRGDFPPLPVVNMLAEQIPIEPGTSLQSRPGLVASEVVMGSGPVRGIYTADNVLATGLFGVSGNKMYEGDTELGAVDGTGHVSFAGYEDLVFTTGGQSIFGWDGTDLSPIAFPDDAPVTKVVVGASRLVAIRADTGIFYWTGPLGVSIDALDFATAENSPDRLLDMLYVGDKLILFGAETVEFWPVTGDSESPFVPLIGATYPVGIKATGTAVNFARTFAWITNNNEICVEKPENIISETELQVRIKKSYELSMWTFYVDDNEYLAVRIDGETWVYGARSQVWSKFETGTGNWTARCFDGGYFGSGIDGTLYEWEDSLHSDYGNPMSRRFSAWLPITSGSLNIANIVLRSNPGQTPFTEGEYSEPVVELRTSLDGGSNWHPWKPMSLGKQGEYRRKIMWSSLGMFSYPGVLVEIRVSDPVPFRVSGLVYNEPYGGV